MVFFRTILTMSDGLSTRNPLGKFILCQTFSLTIAYVCSMDLLVEIVAKVEFVNGLNYVIKFKEAGLSNWISSSWVLFAYFGTDAFKMYVFITLFSVGKIEFPFSQFKRKLSSALAKILLIGFHIDNMASKIDDVIKNIKCYSDIVDNYHEGGAVKVLISISEAEYNGELFARLMSLFLNLCQLELVEPASEKGEESMALLSFFHYFFTENVNFQVLHDIILDEWTEVFTMGIFMEARKSNHMTSSDYDRILPHLPSGVIRGLRETESGNPDTSVKKPAAKSQPKVAKRGGKSQPIVAGRGGRGSRTVKTKAI